MDDTTQLPHFMNNTVFYFQLYPEIRQTPFSATFATVENILQHLGYKLNPLTGAWRSGQFVFVASFDELNFYASVSLGKQEQIIHLSKTKGQNFTMRFYFDLLCLLGRQIYFTLDSGIPSNDHFVSYEATDQQIIESIRTRVGNDGFHSVYYIGNGQVKHDVPKTKSGPA